MRRTKCKLHFSSILKKLLSAYFRGITHLIAKKLNRQYTNDFQQKTLSCSEYVTYSSYYPINSTITVCACGGTDLYHVPCPSKQHIFISAGCNMEFRILELTDSGTYFSGPSNSNYLTILSNIFTDGLRLTRWIIDDLPNLNFKGLAGNITSVKVLNEQFVTVNYLDWIDWDTETIKILRTDLLKIAKEGLALMLNQVPYLVLTREDEYSPIVVTDQLPEGMELFIEGKQTKALYLGKKY